MLTERMQRKAILDLVTLAPGHHAEPERFDEPWRSTYLTTAMYMAKQWEPMEALGYAVTVGLRAQYGDKVPVGAAYDMAISELMNGIERSGKRDEFRPKTLRQVAQRHPPVAWLWPGWLPKGMMSLVAARPGAGKTHWVLDLVRVLQQGSAWPDGTPAEQGETVWIEGEGISPEIMERSVALGIDPDRMWMIEASDGEILDLTATAWRDEVIETTAAVKPRLIVVDSLSTISPNGQDRSEQVTPLLVWLVGLARWSRASVVLVHHLRKSNGAQMEFPIVRLEDIRGSGQIVAQSRSIIAVNMMGYDLDAQRRVEVLKKTLSRGASPKPMGVTGVKDDDGLIRRFDYGEAPSVENGTMRQDCKEWLVDLLEDGPMRRKAIQEVAEEEGYNWTMLQRAHRELLKEGKLVYTKGRQHPQNEWALAGYEEAAQDDGDEI